MIETERRKKFSCAVVTLTEWEAGSAELIDEFSLVGTLSNTLAFFLASTVRSMIIRIWIFLVKGVAQ